LLSTAWSQPRRSLASAASFDHKAFTENFLAAVAEVQVS
jgi:hypothetical protein